MKRKAVFLAVAAVVLTHFFFSGTVFASDVWVVDILTNPARYWNVTVTVTGQVQTVTADPIGTTRGTYTLFDESSPNPLTVRTNELPPIGRHFKVTGVIIQDPNQANVPLMRELRRDSPGMSSTMLYMLIGAGVVFFFLLILFIVLLTKPKKPPVTQETIRPGYGPSTVPPPAPPQAPTQAPDFSKTTKLAPEAPPMPSPAKTAVFINLGADIVVEKGPEKGKEFTLHQQVTAIGRPGSRKNDIELNDDSVSKAQASIYYDAGTKRFSIANESATNPTKVNKAAISGPVLLEDGVEIEMGKTVLRFKKTH